MRSVKLLNGNIEELYDEYAARIVLQGLGKYVDAAEQGTVKFTSGENAGIETAMLEPQKAEHAVLKFIRTLRSRG